MYDHDALTDPSEIVSDQVHSEKYRLPGETRLEAMYRIANHLADDSIHYRQLIDILIGQRFLPAGRIQSSAGTPRETTAFNCFVSDTIPDSMDGIMDMAKQAAATMRLGGGIGYDFSTIRPRGSNIHTLDAPASGPVSFMEIFDAVCKTIVSAGNRRGAQMGVLRIDHPDIEEFIHAKQNSDKLRNFNISVGITDEFMIAVMDDDEFELKWGGRAYKTVKARRLWDLIMRSTWDWAEPGVLFIDRINYENNLEYCETIAASNPCGEQPLPPGGACLLGSFNLTKYLVKADGEGPYTFDFDQLAADVHPVVRMMDNVIDRTVYPLEHQELEARRKRRMGLGVTGLANAIEACLGRGCYGSSWFRAFQDTIMQTIANEAYRASALLAKEKGPFPRYNPEKFNLVFLQKLDDDVYSLIAEHGLRNSHLTSVAPTGTISLAAGNISSGIEPVFSLHQTRTIKTPDGERQVDLVDYGLRVFGVEGKTSDQVTVDEHLGVLSIAQKWVDSACSKTLNVGDDVTWEQFQDIYMRAWKLGVKGCTTFRPSGKRFGILTAKAPESQEDAACTIDPKTGEKSCSD